MRRTSRGELNCKCPFSDHTDNKSSFSINEDSGLYNCFGCGRKGNFVQLVSALSNLSIHKAIVFLKEQYGLDIERLAVKLSFPEYEEINVIRGTIDEVLGYMYQCFPSTKSSQYYLDRGFTEEEWFKWGGREDLIRVASLFPVKNEAEAIVGLIYRYHSAGGMRYENVEGSDPKSTLYGIEHCKGSEEVIVVEGLFDTHRVARLYPDHDVLGLLGTVYSAKQVALLCKWERICVWLDNDEEGEEATLKLAKELVEKGKRVYIIPYLSSAKDQASAGYSDKAIQASYDLKENYLQISFDFS